MTDQVICVDDSLLTGESWYGDAVVKGQIYTIRGVKTHPTWPGPGVLLMEVSAGQQPIVGGERTYKASRFRPYTPPPATDIEIFREIDRKVFERKGVDA